MSATIELELDEETLMRLRTAAFERRTSAEDLAHAAVVSFLAGEASYGDGALASALDSQQSNPSWQVQKIKRGLADVEQGAVVSDQEIDRILHKYDD